MRISWFALAMWILACSEERADGERPSRGDADVSDPVSDDLEVTEGEGDAGPGCDPCELDAERCDTDRVLRCAELARSSCHVWVVAERCDSFQVCDDLALRCVEAPVEPHGFPVPVADIGSGVHVLDVLWDGEGGLAAFQTLRGAEPILGLARFDRQGPVGVPFLMGGVGRAPRLVDREAARAMVWLDANEQVQLGSVVAGGLTDVRDVTRSHLAGNLHLTPHRQGLVLIQQDSQQVYVDLIGPAPTPRPYDLEARLGWYRPTVAVLDDAADGDLVVWVDAADDALDVGRFAPDGTRVAVSVWSAESTFELPAVLGLLPGAPGQAPHVIWSAVAGADRFDVFVGQVTAELDLERVGDTGAEDLDFGIAARLIGHGPDRFWLSFASRDGHSLRFAELGLDARVHGARTLLPEGRGAAAVSGGEVAFCWGVDFEGLRCQIEAAAP